MGKTSLQLKFMENQKVKKQKGKTIFESIAYIDLPYYKNGRKLVIVNTNINLKLFKKKLVFCHWCAVSTVTSAVKNPMSKVKIMDGFQVPSPSLIPTHQKSFPSLERSFQPVQVANWVFLYRKIWSNRGRTLLLPL